MSFGDRLRKTRKHAKLSQADLGAQCNPPLHRQTVYQLEAGSQQPSLEKLASLAEALGVSRCWLAYGIDCKGTQ